MAWIGRLWPIITKFFRNISWWGVLGYIAANFESVGKFVMWIWHSLQTWWGWIWH